MECEVCGKDFPSWDDPNPPNYSIGVPVAPGRYVALRLKTNPEILCFDCLQQLKTRLATWWCMNQWCDIQTTRAPCISAMHGGKDG